MKKIFLSFILLLSLFIGISSVSAVMNNSIVVDFDVESALFKNTYQELESKLQQLEDYLLNNNFNSNRWFIGFGYVDNKAIITLHILKENDVTTQCFNRFFSYSSYVYQNLGCETGNIGVAYLTYNYSGSSNQNDWSHFLREVQRVFESNNAGDFTSGSRYLQIVNNSGTISKSFSWFDKFNNFLYPYASYHVDLKNVDSGLTSYPFKVNKVTYYENDVFEDYKTIVKNSKTVYSNTVNTTHYQGIKFKFDKSAYPAVDGGRDIDIKLRFELKGSILPELNIPYINKSYSIPGEIGVKTSKDYLFDNIHNLYEKDYVYHADGYITDLYVYLPFDFTGYYNVDIYFESSKKFEVELIDAPATPEDVYMKVIDITGKYGVALIPKTKSGDNYFDTTALFRMNDGGVLLEIYDDYNKFPKDSSLVESRHLTRFEIFQYKFSMNNQKYLLFFKNSYFKDNALNQGNDSKVRLEYDSRYFNYSIVSLPNSEVVITNPNDNSDVLLDFEDRLIEKSKEDTDRLNTSFSKAFSFFYEPIKQIFIWCTNFYDGLLVDIQYYFIVIFVFGIGLILVKFIL